MSKIQWPDDFASDEELSRLIDNVHLTLGSVFDAFSMLEFSESTFDAQFNDATELINN